jgi:predicted site-specific integrase-resolvase
MFQYGCVNLSDWAERVGVSKFTAYRWFREGTLPVPAQKVGRLILVDMRELRESRWSHGPL